jgi:hypothetical protein
MSESKNLSKFEASQEWTYKTRPKEKDSTLIIGKIEEDEDWGRIVHIKLMGVEVKSPDAPGGGATQIAHIPITEEALLECVVEKVASGASLDKFDKGYAAWQEAMKEGKGGVFSGSVIEILDYIEHSVNKSG